MTKLRFQSSFEADALKFRRGDILLRGSLAYGFELLDAVTGDSLHVGVRSIADAVAMARQYGDGELWQVLTDGSGHQIGGPVRIGTLSSREALSQGSQ
jgi:hypothetical protein